MAYSPVARRVATRWEPMTDLSIDRPTRATERAVALADARVAESPRDRRLGPRGRDLAGHRRVLGAVRPAVGHRPGRVLLLVPVAGRSLRAVRLDRPDRVRLFARVPAGSSQPIRALPWQAFMAVWTGILLAVGLRAHRAKVVHRRRRPQPDGAGRRQHPPAPRGGDRAGLPLAGGLGDRAAHEDHARGSGCCGSSSGASGGSLFIALGATALIVAVSFVIAAGRVVRVGRGADADRRVATAPGPRSRSRSSCGCRSRSRSWSGARARTAAGRCRWPGCWPCRRSGTAACDAAGGHRAARAGAAGGPGPAGGGGARAENRPSGRPAAVEPAVPSALIGHRHTVARWACRDDDRADR